MLAISFISAVNRKRKKRREARGLGSSTDDDSEHEAAQLGAPGDPEPPPPRAPSPAPPAAPAPDARSVASGCSTLSSAGRGARRAGAGDEADDERSEPSLAGTDTEGARGRRPSFSSQRLMPGDTLGRRRLARGRADPDGPRAPAPGSASSSSQESLRPPAAAEALGARPSRLETLRLRLRGTADDMAVRLRRPLSPETRRRRSSWRRHTVVVQSPLTDLNSNEWKGRGARAHSDNRDSGLSSLESAKARASSSAASLPPGDLGTLQAVAPRLATASRLHPCL